MISIKKNLFFILILTLQLNATSQNSCFPRSAAYNGARELSVAKLAYESSLIGMENFGNIAIFCDHQQSLKNNTENGIGSLITWSSTNKMSMGGTSNDGTGAVTGTEDLDLYQFGLGERKAGGTATVSFVPKIQQDSMNLFFSSGYKKHQSGFWIKLQTTIGNIRIDPQLTESGDLPELKTAGQYYPIGTFENEAIISSSDGFANLTEAFASQKQIHTNFKKLLFGKINGSRSSTETVGDIIGSVGYNFHANTRNFCGIGIHFIAPTGNKPFNHFAYEPIYGNAGHWGFGSEINIKAVFWSIEAAHAYFQLWMNGKIRHLFAAEQTRSFDLKDNLKGSRYMLVAKYKNTTTNSSTASVNAFEDEVSQLINYSTLPCNSIIPVEIETTFLCELVTPQITVGLGYEFWYRSKEKIFLTGSIHPGLVILGRQRVVDPAHLIDLGFCQPDATMKSQEAASLVTNTETTKIKLAGRSSSKIKNDDIDIDGARALATHSSKIFIDISYKQKQRQYLPHVGILASLEFGTSKQNSINQWGIGLHTGISF